MPGVAESWPLLSIGDLVRFRFSMWNMFVEVIGEIADVELRTETVSVLLPPPLHGNPSPYVVPYLQAILTTKSNMVNASEVLHTPNATEWQVREMDKAEQIQAGRFDIRFGFLGGVGFKIASDVLSPYTTAKVSTPRSRHLRRLVAPTLALSQPKVHSTLIRFKKPKPNYIQKVNEEQGSAVIDIIHKLHGNLPYLIFGPFGTGKSLTIVESILQVIINNPQAKILVCAPSDAACDVLAKRIYPLLRSLDHPSELLRINWWARKLASLPAELLPFCSISSTGYFLLPRVAEMRVASVIVCQCFMAGCLELQQRGWMNDHFTHVFVDETSQAMETEILVPLTMVSHNSVISHILFTLHS